MSWQVLTIISVVSLSVSILLQRVLIHKDKIDPFAYAVVFQAIVGALLIGYVLCIGFRLPNIETLLVPVVISSIAFGLGHIVYAKTLQVVEASAFSVLFATQAIWIMALGILFFGESLSWLQILGSVMIFVSVGILVKNIRSLSFDRGTLLGLTTGLMFGIAITTWSYVGRHTDALSWAAISFIPTALIALAAHPQAIYKMKPLFASKTLPKLLFLGVFYGIGSATMLLAYKYGTFTIVSPLRQTSIIVTVLLALSFLPKERNHISRKILAAIICFVGVVLIVI